MKSIVPHPHHAVTVVMWALLFGLLVWAVVVTLIAIFLTFA